jgi:very-short-patch-repair endonuclease
LVALAASAEVRIALASPSDDRTLLCGFAEHNLRIVIELDGGQHATPGQAARDLMRSAYLHGQGYRVLRFWNNDVLNDVEAVLTAIHAAIKDKRVSHAPTPNPSPPKAGGGE